MSNILEAFLVFIKKKRTITAIIVILSGVIISNIFGAIYRETIREQQINSVVKVAFNSDQFKSIEEPELRQLLKDKEEKIIGFIDISDNTSYEKVEEMFNQKEEITELPKTVYIYEPIYDMNKLKKELKIEDKNNFLVMVNSEEIGRYSFNELPGGYGEIVNELHGILNPKIPRVNPVRSEEASDSTNPEEETSTSEVFFE